MMLRKNDVVERLHVHLLGLGAVTFYSANEWHSKQPEIDWVLSRDTPRFRNFAKNMLCNNIIFWKVRLIRAFPIISKCLRCSSSKRGGSKESVSLPLSDVCPLSVLRIQKVSLCDCSCCMEKASHRIRMCVLFEELRTLLLYRLRELQDICRCFFGQSLQ